MSRCYDRSVLRSLTRYAPSNDADVEDIADEYEFRSRQEKQHYPRGRHSEESQEEIQNNE